MTEFTGDINKDAELLGLKTEENVQEKEKGQEKVEPAEPVEPKAEQPKAEEQPKENVQSEEPKSEPEKPKSETKEEPANEPAEPKEDDFAERVLGKKEPKEEIKEPEFANDFVKELNDMVKSGASPEKVKTFIELSNKDFEGMSSEEAWKMRKKYEDGLTDAEVNYEFKQKFSVDEDDEDDEKAQVLQARLQREANEAKSFLKNKAKGLIDPEALKQTELQKQQQAQLTKDYEDTAKTIAEIYQPDPKEFTVGDKKIQIDIPVDQEFKNVLPEYVKNVMLSNNIPLTNEGVKQVKEILNNVHYSQNMEKVVEHVYNTALKTVTESGEEPPVQKSVKDAPEKAGSETEAYFRGQLDQKPNSPFDKFRKVS